MFYIPKAMHSSSSCSTYLSSFDLVSLCNFGHLGACIMVSHCGFEFPSWLKILSTFPCTFWFTYISSFVENLFMSFVHFSLRCLFKLFSRNYLYILDKVLCHRYIYWEYFLPVCYFHIDLFVLYCIELNLFNYLNSVFWFEV